MKNALILVSVMIFLLLAGCTESIHYTEEEIKNFPPNVQDNIRKEEVDLGMTQEQVRYAWGSPDSIKILEPFNEKAREEWIYSKKATMGVIGERLLLFFDGKLIYIK
jgi:outer membrane protein assembly factor BamE (lipoprotein component of BamABCDE complex)